MQRNQQLRYGIGDNPHRRAFKLQRIKRRHNPSDFAVRLRDCDFHPRLQCGKKIPRRQHQNTVNDIFSDEISAYKSINADFQSAIN